MRTAVTAVLAAALHILIGWHWVVLAGLVGGLISPRRGWLVGGLGVLIAWALLILYNFAVAGYETWRMLETFGGVMGGVPGIVVALATLTLAVLLGVVGGLTGTAVARLLNMNGTPREGTHNG